MFVPAFATVLIAQPVVPVVTIVEGEFTSPIALSVNVVIPFLSTLPDCTITFDFAKNNQSVEMTYCTGDVDHVKTGKVSVPCEDGTAFTFMKSVDAALPELKEVYEIIEKNFTGATKTCGVGSTIFAVKPGDGSAREQAASCQKVLGGWANIANEYATKRYRSNLLIDFDS